MEEQLVTFLLGNEEFAINIMQVQEIIKVPAITRVPKAPSYIEGVINLRGNVIPVVNLKKHLGYAETNLGANARVIVVKVDSSTLGIRVDQVTEVMRLQENNIEPPPPVAGNIDTGYIRGVGKIGERLVVLLGIDKILARELSSYA